MRHWHLALMMSVRSDGCRRGGGGSLPKISAGPCRTPFSSSILQVTCGLFSGGEIRWAIYPPFPVPISPTDSVEECVK